MKKMSKEQAANELNRHDWTVWVGYISGEDENRREVEYYGKFADTKKTAIGAARVMIDNTSPYRIIIQNNGPFQSKDKSDQTHLEDFFVLEDEEASSMTGDDEK